MHAPLLARLAGLDAAAVLRFVSPLAAEARALADARAELDRARAALAERLHGRIPGAEREERRFLLAVRRDCHNGRALGRHRAHPAWAGVRAAAGDEAAAAEAADDRAAALAAGFAARHDAERERQRAALYATLAEPGFWRALSLATPDLVRSGLGTPKGEANLLRYLSRAAVKLSPFSAFTRAALAETAAAAEAPVSLRDTEWSERSLVRVRPYLLDRCAAALFRHPTVRGTLRVVLNGSLSETEPGRFLFLRPPCWAMEGETFAYHPESLARAGLSGPLVEALRMLLARRRPTYTALVRRLAHRLGAARADVEREVDALLEVGFLVLLPPWRTQSGHAEAGMLRWIDGFPAAAGAPLRTVRERLAELVALEAGFAAALEPVAAVEAMDAGIDRLWEACARVGGIDARAGYARTGRHAVYEDVVIAARAEGAWPAAVRVDREAAGEALGSVLPLARIAGLFTHRHDWLLALDALGRTRWPRGGDVPLLEVFHAAQPLWRSFLAFRLEARAPGGWRRSWDPFGLAESGALAAHRERAARRLEEAGAADGEDWRIDPAALDDALAGVPAAWSRAEGGACLFLQPSGDGRWVLNRMKEGTGRFSSRFTPAMDSSARAFLARHLAERGVVEMDDGEVAALLDLRCVQGDTLNVHARQTPRVLTLPGAEAEAPAAARATLGELRVRFGSGTPHLRDAAGRRLLPVQLGFAFEDYLPPLIKFLAAFGPSEMSAPFPPQRWEARDGALRGRRTWLGNVLLHRAAWTVDTAPVRAAGAGADAAEAYARVQRWREALGVPARCFAVEVSRHPRQGERASPQYLDLTSPLFVELFRAIAAAAPERLTLTEALPDPTAFPADGDGSRWGVEVLVDSLALAPRPTRGAPARAVTAAAPP